ncbi:MAG: GNAT family N-acetyltransferase [Clostridiales bacterium]|nr:GNAT family N-acetyltransferase [Clostridiales bacterium]
MSIRRAKPEDVPEMIAIYDHFVRNTAVSFEYETPTVEEFTCRLSEHITLYPWLVWEENGSVLGYAYAGKAFERAAYAWNAEISCYLAEEICGKGIGRKLYAAIEDILRRQGVRKVFAVVTSANAPSVAFHKALGYRETVTYTEVGFKQGKWYDVIWLEKQLQPLGQPKQFPIPWEELK